MRIAAVSTILSLALLAAPALAQTTTGTSGSTAPQTRQSATDQGSKHMVSADTQQRIKQSLEQNGFKNVQVVPETFVIRAQAPDGSRVVMEVSPDHVAGVVIDRHPGTGSTIPQDQQRRDESHTPNSGNTR